MSARPTADDENGGGIPTGGQSMLSVIVPIYNEQSILRDVLLHLFRTPCPIQREWIVVDDASTDGSCGVLEELAQDHPITLLTQPQNRGKGASVIRGVAAARGDFVMTSRAR